MEDSIPDVIVRRSVVLDAGAAGLALGVVSLGGGSLVLFESSGLLMATAGLVATLLVALLVGLWVSAPAAEDDEPPVKERWLGAALALAAAGAYAALIEVNDGLAGGTAGRVGALLLLVTIPAYMLGMAIPVLHAWAERREEAGAGESTGSLTTGWLIAGLLGGVAVGVIATSLFLMQGIGPGPLLLGTAVLLLAPMLLHPAAPPEGQEELLFEADTAFHALRVTEVVYPGDRQPERRLYLNGEEESGELVRSGAPTLAYIAAAEAWLTERTPRGAAYLFLGGGAYTLPRRVAERDARASITVVELDPEVTKAALRFFGLRPEHGVRSVHGDARAFLFHPALGQEFDCVYVDVYGGQESLPYGLVTQEALEAVRDHLRSGGVASFNVIGTTHGPESTRFWSVVRTFATVFPSVALYTHLGPAYPERQNLLLAGSPQPSYDFPSKAGFFERWSRDDWPTVTGSVVYRDLFNLGEGERSQDASPLVLMNREK